MIGKMILGVLAIGMTLFLTSQAFALGNTSRSGSLGSIMKQDSSNQSEFNDRDLSSDTNSGLAPENDQSLPDTDQGISEPDLSDMDRALRDQDQMSDTGSLNQTNSTMQGTMNNQGPTSNQDTSSHDASSYLWNR